MFLDVWLKSTTIIICCFQKYLHFTFLVIALKVNCESYQGNPLDPKERKTSQYHIHKEDGQYEYGYNTGNSAKYEIKTADGITKGAYSYSDPNNILRVTNYVSDSLNGYRARNSKHGRERNIWERLGLEGTYCRISKFVHASYRLWYYIIGYIHIWLLRFNRIQERKTVVRF